MKHREVEGKSFQVNRGSSCFLPSFVFCSISDQQRPKRQFNMNTTEQVLLQNIRSIPKNIDEFQVTLTQLNYLLSVICCTETWLSPNQNFKIFKIKEYQPLIESSHKRRGGGVCSYIKCGINYEIIRRTNYNNIQLLRVRITNEKLRNTMFTCVYNPPSAVKTQTILILQKVLDDIIVAPSTHHLLCGDFNINVLRKSKRLSELISILNGNDLFLQNGNQANRETKTSKTCVDLFFSNRKKQ